MLKIHQLVTQKQGPIIKKLKKCRLYLSAYSVVLQLTNKYNKRIRFSLCVNDIFSKQATFTR